MRIAHAVGENVGWLLHEGGFELSRVERAELDFALKVLKRTLGEVPVEPQPPSPNARPSDVLVPRVFAAQGARGVFVAIGDSMVLAGIADGDLLYVQPEDDLKRARDRVVVCTIRGEHFVKRFHMAAGVVTLKSATDEDAPLTIAATDPAFRLIGVVIAREGVVPDGR